MRSRERVEAGVPGYTLPEFADKTRKTVRQIRYLVLTGRLAAQKVGGRYRIVLDDRDTPPPECLTLPHASALSVQKEPEPEPEFLEIHRNASGHIEPNPVSLPEPLATVSLSDEAIPRHEDAGLWRVSIQRPDGGELTIGLRQSQGAEVKALVHAFLGG